MPESQKPPALVHRKSVLHSSLFGTAVPNVGRTDPKHITCLQGAYHTAAQEQHLLVTGGEHRRP